MFARQLLKFSRPLTRSVNMKGATAAFSARVTIEQAKALPKNYDQMPNDILLSMAIMGDQEAREERLIREIMAVDNIPWYVIYNVVLF
jgi:hypothetical protein